MNIAVQNLIYSQSAAERILNLPPFSVVKVELIDSQQIKVTTAKKQEYCISRPKFLQHFAHIRQLRAKKLQVSRGNYRNLFIVTNPENNHCYRVRTTATKVECKCRDYQKQQEILSKGCCKHGYAVLQTLGFDSLSNYLNRERAVA